MSELAKAWEPEYQVVLTTTDTDVNPAQSFPVGFRANTMEATMREADMHFNPDLGTSHEEIDDFFSTNSVISGTTFYTAPTRDDPKRTSRKLKGDSAYAQLLAEKSLWPIDESIEQDWSGFGQHVEFTASDRSLVNDLLRVEDVLGKTSTATVESVRCRRILLARKTILCNKRLAKDKVLQEVAHLQNLNHTHIVRFIGTYTLGRELSILMYPVAEYNLEHFLESIRSDHFALNTMILSAYKSLSCLSCVLAYLHHKFIKHMDIKPQNILVRVVRRQLPNCHLVYKVYLTDFGITRAYNDIESTETDGWTAYTRKYASPEVVQQSTRGLSADIFSLGCVFLEIVAVITEFEEAVDIWYTRRSVWRADHRQPWEQLQKCISVGGHQSYQANVASLHSMIDSWALSLTSNTLITRESLEIVKEMLSSDPKTRPTAPNLLQCLGTYRDCCIKGQDLLGID